MKHSLLTRRLSYTSSEVAGQLVFCVISFYLLKFYTDVYGISAAAAGSILLFARCVDAIDAPVWGIVFDRTHSRWGKSRPWFLWLCVPFALFGVLTFMTPHLGNTAKIVYAASTYVVCSVLYTGINTPVTSILSALTQDPHERVTLTTFRMFGSKLGVLIVNLTVLKLVTLLGHGDDRKGFMLVMPLYATGTVLLYLLAFRNLEEIAIEDKKHISIKESLSALKGNGPWLIIFLSSLFFWIAFISRISTAPYFFQYVMHRKDLIVDSEQPGLCLAGHHLLPAVLLPAHLEAQRLGMGAGRVGSGAGDRLLRHAEHVGAAGDGRLDRRLPGERSRDGDAVLRPIRQRGLRRMEERDSRRRPADGHRRGLLPEGRKRPGWRPASVDSGSPRLCS